MTIFEKEIDPRFYGALADFLLVLQQTIPNEGIHMRDGKPKKYFAIDSQLNGSGQTSVYCFVDIANGNILKAASWRKPAVGKRGNIYEPETYLRNKENFQYGRWLYWEHNK